MARFVLIHGACHGAWCWRDVLEPLREAGHEAEAIDLPSHGADPTDPRTVTLDDYASAVVAAMPEAGPRTVLVGHSMGGFPISAAAERAPERVERLVYLCAYVPAPGLSLAEMRRAGPRQLLAEAIRVSPDGLTMTFDPDAIEAKFYHDCPPGTLDHARAHLSEQPVAPQAVPLERISGGAATAAQLHPLRRRPGDPARVPDHHGRGAGAARPALRPFAVLRDARPARRPSRRDRPPMTKPCIICVAITGSVPRKKDNPAVPVTIDEQVEATQEAFEAGAAIVHCHVRDDDQNPTSDPERFARLKDGIERHCPGMIVQLSTGGRSGLGQARGGMLPLRPDMASLSVGSNNFPNRVYENPPDLVDWLASEMLAHDVKPEIEAFDLSHILQAASMQHDGRLKGPLYVQFVMGVKNAMPADSRGVRLLCRDAEAGGARCGMVRRRDRAAPDRAQRVVDRSGRTHPHGARGQHPPRPRPARAVERSAGPAGGGDRRAARAAGRDVVPGARDPRPQATCVKGGNVRPRAPLRGAAGAAVLPRTDDTGGACGKPGAAEIGPRPRDNGGGRRG